MQRPPRRPPSADMSAGHVLVVGGTRGSGRAVVRRFAGAGHSVSILGRRRPAEADALGSAAFFCQTDLDVPAARQAAIEACVTRLGPLRHLVFCQRYRADGDAWAGELSVSVSATDEIIRLAVPRFDDASDHSIAIIGSMASRLVYQEQPVGYHVAKAALTQVVRFYAVQLGPLHIRVNAVLPSIVVKEESQSHYADNAQLRELYNALTPLGRVGTSDDIADVVEFLCSGRASFITGQEIVVDGGVSLVGHTSVAARLGH